MTPLLIGYGPSVYSRAARMMLIAKGADFDWREADPFAGDVPEHPMGRVPVLEHDGQRIWETSAIGLHIDLAFDGPPLTPPDAAGQVRAAQLISATDAYVYVPLVRRAYAHAVFRPAAGEPGDPAEVEAGRAAAPAILDMLEGLMPVECFFNGAAPGRADCHLAPMLACFAEVPGADAMIAARPKLQGWLDRIRRTEPFRRMAHR